MNEAVSVKQLNSFVDDLYQQSNLRGFELILNHVITKTRELQKTMNEYEQQNLKNAIKPFADRHINLQVLLSVLNKQTEVTEDNVNMLWGLMEEVIQRASGDTYTSDFSNLLSLRNHLGYVRKRFLDDNN